MEDNPDLLENVRRGSGCDEPSQLSPPSGETEWPIAEFWRELDEVDWIPKEDFTPEQLEWLRESFRRYRPDRRYLQEALDERGRILRYLGIRIPRSSRLYRGPDRRRRATAQELRIIIRHRIKQRWRKLGVWSKKWEVPLHEDRGPSDDQIDWKWDWDWHREPDVYIKRYFDEKALDLEQHRWPSIDEEYPDERALRLLLMSRHSSKIIYWVHLSKRNQLYMFGSPERENFIVSRPWYVFEADVHIRESHYNQASFDGDPEADTRTEWQENNKWKESWGDRPGWKWREESPSPEPEDLADMEFTPSEIDALESCQFKPPAALEAFSLRTPRPSLRELLAQSTQQSHRSDSGECSEPETTKEPIDLSPSLPASDGEAAALATELHRTSISAASYQSDGIDNKPDDRRGLQPSTSASPKANPSSPSAGLSTRGKGSIKALATLRTQGLKIGLSPARKPSPKESGSVQILRRSARIAARAQLEMNIPALSGTVNATVEVRVRVRPAAPPPTPPTPAQQPKKPRARKVKSVKAKVVMRVGPRGVQKPKANSKTNSITKTKGKSKTKDKASSSQDPAGS